MSAWVPEHDKRQSKASAKVTDVTNTSKPGLKSHQAARDIAASEALRTLASRTTAVQPVPLTLNTAVYTGLSTTISQSSTAVTGKRKRRPASVLDSDDSDEDDSHVLPLAKGESFLQIPFLLPALSRLQSFFSASTSRSSHVDTDLSPPALADDLPISKLFLYKISYNFI